jgi:hypothetical protein
MPVLPHDISDLHLAPLLLALEARIDELSKLTLVEFHHHVALVGNRPDWNHAMREGGVISAVQHLIDCHDWELLWTERGVQVSHASHQVTLGVPGIFADYVAGKHRAMQDALN